MVATRRVNKKALNTTLIPTTSEFVVFWDRPLNRPSHSKKEKAPKWDLLNQLFLLSFLAGAAGFEPATYGFGDRRSTS